MSTFRAKDGSGRVVQPLTPQNLRALVDDHQEFVIVDNPAWGGQYFAQAFRWQEGSWHVEVRSGGPDRHVACDVPTSDAAFGILQSWVTADGWWQQAFSWEPVNT